MRNTRSLVCVANVDPHHSQTGRPPSFLELVSRGPSLSLAPRAGRGKKIADDRPRTSNQSGSLNPKLNAESIGPEAELVWARSRLRDRIKAVIAHEDLESQGIPHDEVVQLAPDTELPVGENARSILRTMADGVKGER